MMVVWKVFGLDMEFSYSNVVNCLVRWRSTSLELVFAFVFVLASSLLLPLSLSSSSSSSSSCSCSDSSNASISGSGTSIGKNGGKNTWDTLLYGIPGSGVSIRLRLTSMCAQLVTAIPSPPNAMMRANGFDINGMIMRLVMISFAFVAAAFAVAAADAVVVDDASCSAICCCLIGMHARMIMGGTDGGMWNHSWLPTCWHCRKPILVRCLK
mmetsp:Transcript_17433/g.49215  ORF Transcript_17433/g.49215 Transcript_17433/m.49215 type:complete len:211 (+) Transcript_17433:3391-4023(+)